MGFNNTVATKNFFFVKFLFLRLERTNVHISNRSCRIMFTHTYRKVVLNNIGKLYLHLPGENQKRNHLCVAETYFLFEIVYELLSIFKF